MDELVPAREGADLLIAKAYTAEPSPAVRYHLDWATLRRHLPRIAPRRVLLTHMGPDMLARTVPPDSGCEAAEDGLVVAIP